MDTKKALLEIAVIVAILFIIISLWSKMDINPDTVEKNERTIDSLTSVIADYELNQVKYDMKIDDLSDSLSILKDKMTQDSIKIINLKKKLNEKLTSISNFTDADITKFWTDRYGDSLQVRF